MEEMIKTDVAPKDLNLANTDSVEAELIPVPEEKPVTEKKTTRKRKSRDNQELIEAPIKSMTDKEKENLINHLKEELVLKENKIDAFRTNCEKAYEKLRMMENDYNAMESYFKDRMRYIEEQTNAFCKAVNLSITGGVN